MSEAVFCANCGHTHMGAPHKVCLERAGSDQCICSHFQYPTELENAQLLAKHLRAQLDRTRCNAGHENTLPLALWGCPTCHESELAELRAEVERLRAGGCARDQHTTQFCAEAARLAKERDEAIHLVEEFRGELDKALRHTYPLTVCMWCQKSSPNIREEQLRHLAVCEKHPLRAQLAEKEAQYIELLRELGDAYVKSLAEKEAECERIQGEMVANERAIQQMTSAWDEFGTIYPPDYQYPELAVSVLSLLAETITARDELRGLLREAIEPIADRLEELEPHANDRHSYAPAAFQRLSSLIERIRKAVGE